MPSTVHDDLPGLDPSIPSAAKSDHGKISRAAISTRAVEFHEIVFGQVNSVGQGRSDRSSETSRNARGGQGEGTGPRSQHKRPGRAGPCGAAGSAGSALAGPAKLEIRTAAKAAAASLGSCLMLGFRPAAST